MQFVRKITEPGRLNGRLIPLTTHSLVEKIGFLSPPIKVLVQS
jgi:hypothetical protein